MDNDGRQSELASTARLPFICLNYFKISINQNKTVMGRIKKCL